MKGKKKIKQVESFSQENNRLKFYLFLLIIIPFALYIRSVDFDFSNFDDNSIILSNYNTISDLNNLKEAFTHDAFLSTSAYSFYRPLQTVSFMIDAQIGGRQPWIYHLSNLLLHLMTIIALFFFLKKTSIKEDVSFLLSLFFSIHPLFTNAVAWIPARGDLLVTLFSLLSIITFLKYFENRKIVFLILHAFLFMLALFSKETALLLPVLILMYVYFIKRNEFGLKEISPFAIIWSVSTIIFYFLRNGVIKSNPATDVFGIIPLIKNLPAIPILIGKFLLPYNLSTLPLFDTFSLVTGLIVLAVFTLFAIKYIGTQKLIAVWGIIWFLAFIIPPMLFRPKIADIGYEYFEYRAYMPLIGIILIIGILINDLPVKLSFNKIIYFVCPVLFIYGTISFMHSNDFQGPIPFFTSAINANPYNVLALDLRGCEYLNSGQTRQALNDFESAIKISPSYSHAYANEGVLYHYIGDHYKAEYCFSQALKYEPAPGFDLFFNLAWERLTIKKYDEAILIFRKLESEFPPNGDVYFNLGKAYYSTARFDSALYFYSKSIEMQPQIADIYYQRSLAYSQINKLAEAEQDLALAHKLGFKEVSGEKEKTK